MKNDVCCFLVLILQLKIIELILKSSQWEYPDSLKVKSKKKNAVLVFFDYFNGKLIAIEWYRGSG